MNEDQLANELRRRANAAAFPDLLPAVRSVIDARPQPVSPSRWAPIFGMAGLVAVIVLLVVAMPRVGPGASPTPSTGLLDAPPSMISLMQLPDFVRLLAAGSLRGHTIMTRGEILPYDGPGMLYGNLCTEGPLVQDEAPDYTCLVGRLAGTDPPVYIDSEYLAQIARESDLESIVAPYVWRGIAAPVSGSLVLSVDAHDRVTLLGGTPDDEWVLTTGELATRDPELEPFGAAYVVPSWLTGIVFPISCGAPEPGTYIPHLPGRYCGAPSWLSPDPLVIDPDGYSTAPNVVQVQSGSYSEYGPSATRGGIAEPRAGLYVVASRVEGSGCASAPPCRQWEVIGRVTLNGSDGPVGPIATPDVPTSPSPQPSVKPKACGTIARLIDRTGMVDSCSPVEPANSNEGIMGGEDPSSFALTWTRWSCMRSTTIDFGPTEAGYQLDIVESNIIVEGCSGVGVLTTVEMRLTRPINPNLVRATRDGRPLSETSSAENSAGTFELNIASDQREYVAGGPIDVEATLTYEGPSQELQVSTEFGAVGPFFVEQLDGTLRMGNGGSLLMCHPDTIVKGTNVYPFKKPRGPVDGPPSDPVLVAYYADPLLRLPQGTWRISVWSRFSAGDCMGPAPHGDRETVNLVASVVVVVR